MAPNKQTDGVQSRPECAYSKQLHWAVSCLSLPSLPFLKAGTKFAKSAKTPDLLAFAFAHVRNQSCRLTQHMGSSPINKTRLIGHLQLTG